MSATENRLATAAARLNARLAARASVRVVYSRPRGPTAGGDDECELEARVGETPFESTTEAGVTIFDEHRDFIVAAADLILAGDLATPQRGDRIRQRLGEADAIFEVMAPSGAPPYKTCDAGGLMLRVHTKRVETE
jgi:hypothetical protein